MRGKKITAVFTAAALFVSIFTGFGPAAGKNVARAASFTDLNQSQITAAMGAGWNLGNQLESANNGTPSETAWGNPKITESLIKAVKDAGFKSIRIPVSYLSKIGSAPNYTINSAWLDRIQEVVDMCIDNDLYAVIDMHGDGYTTVDGGWLLCASDNQTQIQAKYKACWQQIAERFKDYDEHLLFESMNEEFDGSYNTPNKTYYANINAYNQIFVDTVRQTGGNNDKRWLIIPGWNTNIAYTAGNYGFEIPTDNYLSSDVPAGQNRIMISVHYYDPWDFCGGTATTQWGSVATDSSKTDGWGQEDYLESQFKTMYTTFVQKGYPVFIGEYGATDKSGTDSANAACREYFVETVCTTAQNYGMIPMVWDNGGTGKSGEDNFALFNRSTYKVTQQGIIDTIMAVYDETWYAQSETASGQNADEQEETQVTEDANADEQTAGAQTQDSSVTAQTAQTQDSFSETITDEDSGIIYAVDTEKNTATVTGTVRSKKSVVIPAKVTTDGKTYKVTAIADQAFAADKTLKKVTIGKNVESIGKKAFYGCGNLKQVTIKSKKLKKSTVGKNAFKNTAKKAVFTVPAGKKKSYKKMLIKKGASEKITVQ